MQSQYVGEIRLFAGPIALDFGWLLCNGQAERYDAYESLGALLGNTYGSTEHTFNLPDLRGRTMISVDGAQYLLAKPGGAETVSLADNFPAHTHALCAVAGAGTTNDPNGKLLAQLASATQDDYPYATAVSAWHTLEPVEQTGSSAAHTNMQPSLVVNYYICSRSMGAADGEGKVSS